MHKLTVAVIFGGVSSEHEVSLASAKSVIENIPKDQYEVVMLGITKHGEWLRYSGSVEALPGGAWESDAANRPAVISPDAKTHGILETGPDGCQAVVYLDAVFPVLHGANGEDGTMQGLLTLAGIPFVGCSTAASAVCMDKALTKTMLGAAGVAQAKWDCFLRRDFERDPDAILSRLEKGLGFPIFVKPASAGSSVGIGRAAGREALAADIRAAAKFDKKIVCEEAVRGMEIECAVLGNDDPVVSVCGEIVPCNEFYDYEAKYVSSGSQLHIPAPIPAQKADEVRAAAAKAFRLLGCSGMARVDFFVREDGALLLNEPNTIPGFTSISMYPKLFEASGVPYGELLSRLIRLATERKPH
ncbi:MAG: D-alanine--D-alanine ligase [Clostridia bacterium]|nr:D-alanine--D-alanine ligase [Clostridia bacterium]